MTERAALLEGMMRLRAVETRIAERYPEQQMRCPTHLCVGQEAAPVAFCAPLARRDVVLSHHRSHGHYLAKGGDLDAMIAEMYGRATGCAGGKGGSMHLVDLDAGFLGAVPIVGSTIPIATGAALGARLRGEDRVAVVFLGDAAVEEGVTHESLSFASLERLPVIFVCENNLYSVQTPLGARQPDRPIHRIADAHGVPHAQVHGEDVFAVHALAEEAVARARAGEGPTFVEVLTYRYLEHVGPFEDADLGYRTQDEIDAWRARDPIEHATRVLLAEGAVTEDELEAWRRAHAASIDRAFERALAAPLPDPAALHEAVRRGTSERIEGSAGADRRVPFHEAVRDALDLALRHDPRVYLMGLGVPDPKGLFGSTVGLVDAHGPERVRDMPASENAMTGVALGAALAGARPVLSHQRVDFALLAMEPMINQIPKWHYMFGGKQSVPLVIRMIVGRGWGQGAQHSQYLASLFAHVPGFTVLAPATPADAKGLMLAAIESDDPVVIFEHRWLFNVVGDVPEGVYRVPIGEARVAREGADVTIAACSYMVLEALRAAERLAADGVEAEVLDLRSLAPLDVDALEASVRKTGHLVVADVGWTGYGASAEIVAAVTERAFDALRSAPRRVASPDVPSPSAPSLSEGFWPRARQIVDAVRAQRGLPELPPDPPSALPTDVPDPTFTGPF